MPFNSRSINQTETFEANMLDHEFGIFLVE